VHVHFPNTPNLISAHVLVDSKAVYDRSSIRVGRNWCELPERGQRERGEDADEEVEDETMAEGEHGEPERQRTTRKRCPSWRGRDLERMEREMATVTLGDESEDTEEAVPRRKLEPASSIHSYFHPLAYEACARDEERRVWYEEGGYDRPDSYVDDSSFDRQYPDYRYPAHDDADPPLPCHLPHLMADHSASSSEDTDALPSPLNPPFAPHAAAALSSSTLALGGECPIRIPRRVGSREEISYALSFLPHAPSPVSPTATVGEEMLRADEGKFRRSPPLGRKKTRRTRTPSGGRRTFAGRDVEGTEEEEWGCLGGF
jgi:hypothetical protein